jgi:vancomycin permeability regulator SanA
MFRLVRSGVTPLSDQPPSQFAASYVKDACSGVARGVAVFLGTFTLINVLGEFRYPGFDANIWWIDVRTLPVAWGRCLFVIWGVILVAYGLRPSMPTWRQCATILATTSMSLFAAGDVLRFYRLLGAHSIAAGFPVPLSLLVSLCLAFLIARQAFHQAGSTWVSTAVCLVTVVACMFVFPLMQMLCFGRTDYRRAADVAVVFGARAYANGQPSDALADRVRTGCELIQQGLVRRLLFSGGPGDGTFHETEVMRKMAIGLGVPAEAIVLDKSGVNTQATVDSTCALFPPSTRILAVSHFYHLPRIKMTCQRAGRDVYTVPARESYVLTYMPVYMLREVAALWVYYLRPLWP